MNNFNKKVVSIMAGSVSDFGSFESKTIKLTEQDIDSRNWRHHNIKNSLSGVFDADNHFKFNITPDIIINIPEIKINIICEKKEQI